MRQKTRTQAWIRFGCLWRRRKHALPRWVVREIFVKSKMVLIFVKYLWNICEIKNGVDAETRQTSIRCSRFTTLQCEATWRWSFKSLFLCRRHKIVLLLSKVVEFLVKQQAIDLNCQDKQVGWSNSQVCSQLSLSRNQPHCISRQHMGTRRWLNPALFYPPSPLGAPSQKFHKGGCDLAEGWGWLH